jgi:hypothetical protein
MKKDPEGIHSGDVFGSLTVVQFHGRNARSQAIFQVKCACGSVAEVLGTNLKKGNTTSCDAGFHRAVHGLMGTPEYKRWRSMMSRVQSSNPRIAPSYRDRGISVCAQWARSFVEFLNYIGPMPEPGMEVDRILNDGNYEPGNVRWATRKEQMRNTRANHLVSINGISRCLSEWAEISGVSVGTLTFRLKRKWPESELLSPPTRKHRVGRKCA